MAGSKSDWLEVAIAQMIFHDVPLTLPATLYVALSTAAYSDAGIGASEVVGGSYARVPMARDVATWSGPSGTPTAIKNAGPVSYPVATASWGTVTSFYIYTALTGGNPLYGGDLAVPKLVAQGDSATFYAETILITEE